MPMYDYTCKDCGHQFEELVFSSSADDQEITCPKCGEKKAERQLSAPSVSMGGGGTYSGGGCSSSGGFT